MISKAIILITTIASCFCKAMLGSSRAEAEYYVTAYAKQYHVPLEFVRAIVEQESGWRECAVSSAGAVGLMRLMPDTARRLGVQNRCDISQNISGGVRYLAWLMNKFHGDLRLVSAAYYAGERIIAQCRLRCSNPEVLRYVLQIRDRFDRYINPRVIHRRTR